MRDTGLVPRQPRPWRHCLTESDGQAGPIPDLVERDFTADAPGHKLVGDITYIATWEGRLYVAHRHRLPHQGCYRVGHG
jgi:putative transposase